MSYNEAERTLTWPDKLVWSSSMEVQALLADVPLVALGILGLASGTLLFLTARMTRHPFLLVLATLFGFTAGFFHMLNMLRNEGLSEGSKGLDIVVDIALSVFTVGTLLFLHIRTSHLVKPQDLSGSPPTSYFESEKEEKAETVTNRIRSILAVSLFKVFVAIFQVVLFSLNVAWRILLHNNLSPSFKPVFLATNTLELVYLLFYLSLLFVEGLVWLRGGKIAYVLLPLAIGCILAISIRITGYPLLTFVDTPLARLLTATQIYLWLLDILFNTFLLPAQAVYRDEQSASSGVEHEHHSLRTSVTAPTVPPKTRSPFRLTKEIRVSPFGSLSNEKADNDEMRPNDRANYSEHRKTLSLGPVIRRGSRLPSWITERRPASPVSIHKSLLPYDAGNALSVEDVNDDESKRNNEEHQVPSLEEGHYVEPQPAPTLEKRHTSTFQHDGIARPVYLTARNNSGYEGSKLDSPLDTPMGFGAAQQPPNKAGNKVDAQEHSSLSPSPSFTIRRSGDAAEVCLPTDQSGTPHLSPGGVRHSRISEREDLSRNTSLYSRHSRLSLSGFPNPPGNSINSRQSLRMSKQPRRSTSPVKEDLDETEYDFAEPLHPPVMPAAGSSQHHAHSSSWQSDDTFTGSAKEGLLPPMHKGYNVTSFIGSSAGTDQSQVKTSSSPPTRDVVDTHVDRDTPSPEIQIQIMRASSLTRHSARLQSFHQSARSTKPSEIDPSTFVPPARLSSKAPRRI